MTFQVVDDWRQFSAEHKVTITVTQAPGQPTATGDKTAPTLADPALAPPGEHLFVLTTLLGYEPARDLADGLRETLDWLASNGAAGPVPLRRPDWPDEERLAS